MSIIATEKCNTARLSSTFHSLDLLFNCLMLVSVFYRHIVSFCCFSTPEYRRPLCLVIPLTLRFVLVNFWDSWPSCASKNCTLERCWGTAVWKLRRCATARWWRWCRLSVLLVAVISRARRGTRSTRGRLIHECSHHNVPLANYSLRRVSDLILVVHAANTISIPVDYLKTMVLQNEACQSNVNGSFCNETQSQLCCTFFDSLLVCPGNNLVDPF